MKNRYIEVIRSFLPLVVIVVVLHGLIQIVVGLTVGGIDVAVGDAYGVQKDVLANKYLLLALSRQIMPLMVFIYALLLGLSVILGKSFPPKNIPMPVSSFELAGAGAIRIGYLIIIFSSILLLLHGVVIYKHIKVYLMLS